MCTDETAGLTPTDMLPFRGSLKGSFKGSFYGFLLRGSLRGSFQGIGGLSIDNKRTEEL